MKINIPLSKTPHKETLTNFPPTIHKHPPPNPTPASKISIPNKYISHKYIQKYTSYKYFPLNTPQQTLTTYLHKLPPTTIIEKNISSYSNKISRHEHHNSKNTITRKPKEETTKLNPSLEKHLSKTVAQKQTLKTRQNYIEASLELLDEARKELKRNNIRQAAEKIWSAVALAVKAYAFWKEGKRLTSHRELWTYKSIIASELGDWVRDTWAHACSMHICFYENWCTKDDVDTVLKKAEKLVKEIAAKISKP